MDETTKEAILICKDLGLINEIKLRNFFIRSEFYLLKGKGYLSGDVIRFLMDKYHLSWSVMNTITYDYSNNKKKPLKIDGLENKSISGSTTAAEAL